LSEIIDLSPRNFLRNARFIRGLPGVKDGNVRLAHEQWDGITRYTVVSQVLYKLEIVEHTGLMWMPWNHNAVNLKAILLNTMPLTMFYNGGKSVWICLHRYKELKFEPSDLNVGPVLTSNTTIKEGEHSLIVHGPLRRTYGGADLGQWSRGI